MSGLSCGRWSPPSAFPIPMRGNEAGKIVTLTLAVAFPIPMRGNEARDVFGEVPLSLVSNPHEG